MAIVSIKLFYKIFEYNFLLLANVEGSNCTEGYIQNYARLKFFCLLTCLNRAIIAAGGTPEMRDAAPSVGGSMGAHTRVHGSAGYGPHIRL